MSSTTPTKYSLVFYAPSDAIPACKAAIFEAGAGKYPGPGGYTDVCWSTTGNGQFRPGITANPTIGKQGQLEELAETRVEILCVGIDVAKNAVKALKETHPYEEVAYHVIKVEDL
ncbi:hypothetical protein LIA77_08436 [Sarocladium implicatum]|nr:hypothetical protein LIA77_08436 [Sarocladium implicatum]